MNIDDYVREQTGWDTLYTPTLTGGGFTILHFKVPDAKLPISCDLENWLLPHTLPDMGEHSYSYAYIETDDPDVPAVFPYNRRFASSQFRRCLRMFDVPCDLLNVHNGCARNRYHLLITFRPIPLLTFLSRIE